MTKKQPTGGTGTAVLEQPSTTKVEQPKALPSEFKSVALTAVVEARGPNTRPKISPESIAELAASIKAQGLLQPIIVGEADANGLHQILAGRRRLAAVTHLGHARVNAVVLDGGAARALEVLLTENQQRKEPDPLLEADVIAELLERPNWGQREVAAALGVSESWVARRAHLTSLSKAARVIILAKREKDPTCWPVTWLEELATAPSASQAVILEHSYIQGFADLRESVREAMRSLGAASWPLEDPTITKAGACSTCKKHSAAVPSLFPEENALHELKSALCLDAECFANKRMAWTKRRAAEFEKEEGMAPMLLHGVRSFHKQHIEDEEFGKGVKIRGAHEFTPTKKEDKGAKPALVVDGPKAGQVVYVRHARDYNEDMERGAPARTKTKSGSAKREKSEGPKKSLVERRAELQLRRKRHAYEEFCAEIDELRKGGGPFKELAVTLDNDDVLRLAAAFLVRGDNPHANSQGSIEKVRTKVLEHVLDEAGSGTFKKWMGSGANVVSALHDVETFLKLVRWNGDRAIDARIAKATTAVPEPKSWAEEKSAAKSPKSKAKAKATKSAKHKAGK